MKKAILINFIENFFDDEEEIACSFLTPGDIEVWFKDIMANASWGNPKLADNLPKKRLNDFLKYLDNDTTVSLWDWEMIETVLQDYCEGIDIKNEEYFWWEEYNK
tara:strand:- start:1542 stop:1856 length:315 start_codon:yes stop_codon:yes gene_type:complete